MNYPRFLWRDPEQVPRDVQNQLGSFSSIFQSVLYQRGFSTNEDVLNFLLPKKQDWYASIDLGHVEKSCQIIKEAIEKGETIAIYGDYDADGVTATALLVLALRQIDANVIPYIPDRLKEGYGLNIPAIDSLYKQGVKLLITVDNGIRSHSEVAHAIQLKMNVVITDHHTPAESLPDASAIINPKIPGDPYPGKNLAGVGVAYKLIFALSKYFPRINSEEFLDLVAIGTVADLVPLTGENRYLVRQGLIQINQHRRQSIFSLLGAANLSGKEIRSSDISFQIGPRINASGRLVSETALTPLNLLLSSTPNECGELAQSLENHNTKRKLLSRNLEKKVGVIASALVPKPSVLIILEKDIPLGIAGIAAGYLCRQYNIPAIVGQTGNNFSTASCRSIPAFNIIKALDICKDLFSHYGGHAMAAGFTMSTENLPVFKERFQQIAHQALDGLDLHPELNFDAEVSLSQLNENLYKELKKLEPTGEQNPIPIFFARNLNASQIKAVGNNADHLKMVVTDRVNSIDAIGFGMGDLAKIMPVNFDIAFNFTVNEYRGVRKFQLNILDLKST